MKKIFVSSFILKNSICGDFQGDSLGSAREVNLAALSSSDHINIPEIHMLHLGKIQLSLQ